MAVAWTEERRKKFEATMAAKKRDEPAEPKSNKPKSNKPKPSKTSLRPPTTDHGPRPSMIEAAIEALDDAADRLDTKREILDEAKEILQWLSA